ncbi:MAG: hypothetical protein V3U13_03105 [Gemmatimonadota bacterium]
MAPPSKRGPLGTLIAEYLAEEDILESGILAELEGPQEQTDAEFEADFLPRNPPDIFKAVQARMKENERERGPSNIGEFFDALDEEFRPGRATPADRELIELAEKYPIEITDIVMPTKTDAAEALRRANREADELHTAQRRLDAGPPHPDAAGPKGLSKTIPEGHLHENWMSLPEAMREKLHLRAVALLGQVEAGSLESTLGAANELAVYIAGTAIEHYRRLASAGGSGVDTAPAPELPSSEIPEDDIQQNALLVPAVVRKELEDNLRGRIARAGPGRDWSPEAVRHILGTGIEHYRRLASATDEHFVELDRQRDEALQDPELWGKSVLEDLPEDDLERQAAIQRRLAAIHQRAREHDVVFEEAPSRETPEEETCLDTYPQRHTYSRVLLKASTTWRRQWVAADTEARLNMVEEMVASKKTPQGEDPYAHPAFFDVACPVCAAAPGEVCSDLAAAPIERGQSHKDRALASARNLEAASKK